MVMVDTHTHLYAEQFDEDRAEMIVRAIEAGVSRFYLPNIDSNSIAGMMELEKQYPNQFFPMMGLHPCSVKADYKKELDIVEKWLNDRPFVAVGEIGIDLYWDKTFFEEQKDAFRTQIKWAKELNIPIVIHARDALDVIIDIVTEEKDDTLNGIFHCFTGTEEQAQKIADLDFYMGLGGVLTFKNAGLDKIAVNIPLNKIVLETDSPYLAPKPKRGKRNETAYILYVAKKLAEIKGLSLEEITKITTQNANKVFNYQEVVY
ncbi:MAG: TatD family hydrolase [Saprospiraceae bacterium]